MEIFFHPRKKRTCFGFSVCSVTGKKHYINSIQVRSKHISCTRRFCDFAAIFNEALPVFCSNQWQILAWLPLFFLGTFFHFQSLPVGFFNCSTLKNLLLHTWRFGTLKCVGVLRLAMCALLAQTRGWGKEKRLSLRNLSGCLRRSLRVKFFFLSQKKLGKKRVCKPSASTLFALVIFTWWKEAPSFHFEPPGGHFRPRRNSNLGQFGGREGRGQQTEIVSQGGQETHFFAIIHIYGICI